MAFEDRLKVYDRYLWKVAERYKMRGPFSSVEDLYQDLCISLWKCHEKYGDRSEQDFHDLVIASISNTIATVFRLACHKHDRETGSLDLDTKFRYSASDCGPKSTLYKELVPARTDYGDEFFSARIVEILGKVSPRAKVEIMEALDRNSGKKLTVKSSAYFEVKMALDGE